MRFRDLQDDVLDRTDYSSGGTIQPFVRQRVERILNSWHRRLLSKPELSRLRDRVATFTSVTTTAGLHTLPMAVARISRIYETTNRTRLTDRSLDWLRMNPDAGADTGNPEIYVPVGLCAVTAAPASTGLWVASSSASDTVQKVSVDAVRSGGYTKTPAPVTLNGTTRVAIDPTITNFTDVLKFWVNGLCLGDITLYDAAAAGNALAVIPIGHLASRYQGLYLYPAPASALTYTLEYMVRIPEMRQEHDEPILPEEFHDVLSAAARYEELVIKEKYSSAEIVKRQELDPRIKELCSFVSGLPDTVIVPGRTGALGGGSNLGPFYPAGRY
jgi:hypothetical protein